MYEVHPELRRGNDGRVLAFLFIFAAQIIIGYGKQKVQGG
jgi:hypothetical protein